MREEAAAFPAAFRGHLETGLARLADHNLDTGAPEGEGPPYSRAAAALRALAARSGRSPAAPAPPPATPLATP